MSAVDRCRPLSTAVDCRPAVDCQPLSTCRPCRPWVHCRPSRPYPARLFINLLPTILTCTCTCTCTWTTYQIHMDMDMDMDIMHYTQSVVAPWPSFSLECVCRICNSVCVSSSPSGANFFALPPPPLLPSCVPKQQSSKQGVWALNQLLVLETIGRVRACSALRRCDGRAWDKWPLIRGKAAKLQELVDVLRHGGL